jgi:ketosteroid isomerase-like protein
VSQENAEIVRRMAEAFTAGGLDAVRPHLHPQIEWHEDPSFPESGVYRGVEEVAAYTEQFLSGFAGIRYEAVEVADAGEHVIATMRITGTGKTSGAAFEVSAWWAFTFDEGRVIRCYAYLDRDAAFKAVGLPE